MKRNLNEGAEFEYDDSIKICVSEIRNDDPELDCNELRDMYVEAGANVEGSHGQYNGKAATFMTVTDLYEDEVMDILNDFLSNSDTVRDAEEYIIPEGVETDYVINPEDADNAEEADYPAYEDVDINPDDFHADELDAMSDRLDALDPEEDQLNDELDNLNEDVDIIEEAKAELQGLLDQLEEGDSIEFEGAPVVLDSVDAEFIGIDADGNLITETDDAIDAFNAFDLTDSDDIYTLCDVIKDELDAETDYPAYDDVDTEDLEELPRFEKFHKGHRLEEKKKGCCPGTTNMNESIDAVLADIDAQALNEAKEADAKNQKALEKKTLKALTENKHSLHDNIRYNGKSFDKMTLKELKSLYETVKASVDELSKRTLNESVVEQKAIDTIENKKKLLEFLDEEITYRTTRMECLNKLNEDGAEISDEELKNLFGPAQGEDAEPEDETPELNDEDEKSEEGNDDENNKDENNEDENNEDEEVELSRIEITLKDAEAANDLKQACLDADIPEDAFELENVDEDTFEDEDENSEESDENSEESKENSEESSEETSESIKVDESYEYAKYVKALLEGEIPDEQPTDDTASEEGGEEENSADNTDGENNDENTEESNEEEEDKQPKFILTNTDYAAKLAKVLEDIYGISKDEFEDMIGGSIVEEESDEESEENSEDSNDENSDENSEENSDENSEENSDENSEDKKDNDDEEIDPSDLFKNL